MGFWGSLWNPVRSRAEFAREACRSRQRDRVVGCRLARKRLFIVPGGAKRLNQDQLENTLREMGQFSDTIPSLPDEALTRESLYQDHD